MANQNSFVLFHSVNHNIHTPKIGHYNDLWCSMRNQLISTQSLVKPKSSGFDTWNAWLNTETTHFEWKIVEIPKLMLGKVFVLVFMANKVFGNPRFFLRLDEAQKQMEEDVSIINSSRNSNDEDIDIQSTSAHVIDHRDVKWVWVIHEITVPNLN